jgi:Tetracyclin repressor-like, C-terminal domain
MLREFLTAELLPVIARLTGHPDARLRASLVAAQLMGIAMLRHVIRVGPLARASRDDIVSLVTPAIDRYLRQPTLTTLPLRAVKPVPFIPGHGGVGIVTSVGEGVGAGRRTMRHCRRPRRAGAWPGSPRGVRSRRGPDPVT